MPLRSPTAIRRLQSQSQILVRVISWLSLAKGTKPVRSSAMRCTLSMTQRSSAKSSNWLRLLGLGEPADDAALDRARRCGCNRRVEHHGLGGYGCIDRYAEPRHR